MCLISEVWITVQFEIKVVKCYNIRGPHFNRSPAVVSALRELSSHTGSLSFTCHLTKATFPHNPSRSWYSIYPAGDERPSCAARVGANILLKDYTRLRLDRSISAGTRSPEALDLVEQVFQVFRQPNSGP